MSFKDADKNRYTTLSEMKKRGLVRVDPKSGVTHIASLGAEGWLSEDDLEHSSKYRGATSGDSDVTAKCHASRGHTADGKTGQSRHRDET